MPTTHRTYYETQETFDVALNLLDLGYNPFPCGKPISKKKLPNLGEAHIKALKVPMLTGKGEMLERVYNAVPTRDSVTALPFPSFLTAIQARNLIVIDLDSKHAGFVDALEACQLAFPHYGTQSTMSHGRHFMARLPDGVKAANGAVRWHGQIVGETRAGNAYICVYQPEMFKPVADLPEFDPDELPDGLTLTNTGLGELVGKDAPHVAQQAVDGALGTLETLMLSTAPQSRHETLCAVLNVAHRLGVLDGAIEILESDAVRGVWCSDGSRDARAWQAEIGRWADSVRDRAGKGYGLPYLKAQGFDVAAVAVLLDSVQGVTQHTWGQLKELSSELPSAASLPADMIPAALREWLEGAAAAACVPLEVLTVPALVAASGVIGRSVTIHPRDFSNWTVAPNLWGAIVAPPGTMKSDMMGEALRPVSALEITAKKAYIAAKLEADVEHDQLEAEYSGLKQKAKKGGGDKNAMLEIKQRLAALENVPRKRYTTSDATCEKLGELLCDNQRGLILTRDELASWISSMEREENHTARGFFLTSWNGTSPYTFDRIGRGTVDIPAMCVSVLGAIQPLPLRAVFSRLQEDETRADGLMQRFQLFVYPDGLPEWKAPRSWPNHAARNAALEVFKRLDALEQSDAETGDLEPRELRFSSDAQTVFDDWHDALEHRLRGTEDAKTPHFHSHISKYRSLAPSLAVVFHLLESAAHPHWRDWDQLEPVSLDALELALCWVEFLELHARKIYAPELNLSSVAAHALSKRIKDGSVTDAMTVRTLRRRDWSGLRGAALDAALTELEALNWVRLETLEARGDQGGAPSEIVRLHPDLMGGKA